MKKTDVLTLSMCIIIIYSGVFAQSRGAGKIINNNGSLYLANTVVVKFKNSTFAKKGKIASLPARAAGSLKSFSVRSVERKYSPMSELTDLSQIVEIKYSAQNDPKDVAASLIASGEVEWAEPRYVYNLDYATNDPSYPDQWGLQKIMAAEAWDISRGDTNVVIGIVDSGVDWNHPDLNANIKINRREIPDNGIDDDNNGYIDDVRGWDFGGFNDSPDNNPIEDRADHGTHVAGIAGAVTNNGVGISSIGYNCRLLPVKTTSDNLRNANGFPYVIYGYEGIIYAADNGCRIINCSWGGNQFSQAGLDAVRYAQAKGALVVASAGNTGSSATQYPAAFPGVFSVASTNQNDVKSSFSSYSKYVTVSAPGEAIYSTWFDDTYTKLQGTSMAAPLVAGLAALVASKFPSYNAEQIGEQVRVTTDNINAANGGFEYLVGSGRINAYKAISEMNAISVRAKSFAFSDELTGGNGNNSFEIGETVSVSVNFMNVLNSLPSVSVSLECNSPYVTIINGVCNSGFLPMSGQFSNSNAKFTFKINADAPPDTYVSFLLKYSSGEYQDYQWIDSVIINQSFQTLESGKAKLTIASTGSLGFSDWFQNTFGQGFRYNNGINLLYEGALMFGNSAARISNAARGIVQKDSSFVMIQSTRLLMPGPISDEQVSCSFNDDGALDKKSGIETHLTGYAWKDAPNDKFIILNYKMINKSRNDITNFYAGLYLDWNLTFSGEQTDNAAYDEQGRFGYVCHPSDILLPYVGCAILSNVNENFYAIENGGRDGGLGVYAGGGGFTKAEKWTTLSSGLKKMRAENGDVSFVISAGPYNLKAADTINAAFAILAGDNLNDLRNTASCARVKYKKLNLQVTGIEEIDSNVPKEFLLKQNYPNPFNPTTEISFSIPSEGFVNLNVYNILGQKVKELVNEWKPAGNYSVTLNISGNLSLTSGIYFYTLEEGGKRITRKMVVLK